MCFLTASREVTDCTVTLASRMTFAREPTLYSSCLTPGLGKLAARHPDVVVQSHISESHDAVAFSRALHPEVDGRDIQLFDTAGLLTSPVRLATHDCCDVLQQ